MIARRFLILLAVVAVATGCRLGRDPSVDTLEAEVRWLEDQLYAMGDEIAMQNSQLESCRRENAALRKELNGDESGASLRQVDDSPAGGRPASPDVDIPSTLREPEIDFGTPSLPEIDFGTPADPEIDMGEPLQNGPPGELRESRKPGGAAPAEDPAGSKTGAAGSPTSAADDQPERVERIVLNRQLTGGKNSDGVTGDDGILVVIEPQNAAGQYLAVPAPVSVVVLDPTKTGQAAYVARWNFDIVDTTALLRETMLGRGIYLDLPWPGPAPEHSRLNLYVRYLAADGRKLDVQKNLQVELPGHASSTGPSAVTASRVPRSADSATARAPQPPQKQNPLRSSPDGSSETGVGSDHSSPALESTAAVPPPGHDPNEPPPRWNGGQPSEATSVPRSVVVRRDKAGQDPSRGEQVEQAVRPRPWTPHR